MNPSERDTVKAVIAEYLVSRGTMLTISDDSPLLGDCSVLDSMGLVEVCLRLEDLAADIGAHFDWMSEEAMSLSRGMFRTVKSLQEEFSRQISQTV